MSKARGVVQRIGEGKFGYFLKLEGDERYYNTKYAPKCNEGDEVGLILGKADDRRAQITKLTVLNRGSGPRPQARSSGGGASNDNRQASIIYQSSRKDALEYVSLLLSNEAIKLPAAAKRKEFIDTLLAETVAAFAAAATDPEAALKAPASNDEEPEDEANEDNEDDDWNDAGDDDSGDWGDSWD